MNLFGKRLKGTSGVAIGAMVVLTLAFLVASVSYMMPVAAAHAPTGTLEPKWSPSNELVYYTVELCNGGPDPIDEVRIIKNPYYSSMDCAEMTNWQLIEVSPWYDGDLASLTEMCWYFTLDPTYNIHGGECKQYEFTATTPEQDPADPRCELSWKFETRDEETSEQGAWNSIFVTTGVDVKAPVMQKDIIGFNMGNCPPGEGEECWISQAAYTEIMVTVTDAGICQPPSGLDFCEITYTIDGAGPYLEVFEDLNGEEEWSYSVKFDEDSVHALNVTCADLAGNVLEDVEIFRVDGTPPITTKVISEPKKVILGDQEGEFIEWIDGVTEITFSAPDGGPICAVGLDKTWYMNVIDLTENACYDPYNNCNPLDFPTPYDADVDCINARQFDCAENDRWEDGYDSWEECVEDYVHADCQVDPLWKLYDGTPINKGEESCHVLQYFSVDNLGNIEDMNVNCFFVDLTPPTLEKVVNDDIVDTDPQFVTDANQDGTFHWVSPASDIDFTCIDEGPHPSEGEELCFKVSYDMDADGYNTDDYCTKYSGTLEGDVPQWCCVQIGDMVENTFTFNFNEDEDSVHDLEYFCRDAVNKKTGVKVQYYKVDDTAPSLVNKWINGPSHVIQGACPPTSENDICNIDGVSEIDIEVVDGGDICAVDDVVCKWKYRVYTDGWTDYTQWNYQFPINFPEESKHELVIECEDALGNYFEDVEIFYVDKTKPETTKTYTGPQYPDPLDGEPYPHWITSSTEISLSATDSIGDHDSGIKETKYRYFRVDDSNCYADGYCGPVQFEGGEPEWQTWDGTPFVIPVQSCHQIEYYSVDNVEKTEDTKRQCVFVENTAPTILDKQIGTPQAGDCPAGDGEECYISGQTPITISCEDQGDHPVDHVTLWYRYRFNEDCDNLEQSTWTDWMNPTSDCDGDCSPTMEETIFFQEDSCHELEYYCADALGNEAQHEFEIDVVDNQAPVITKDIVGPQWGDCPPEQGETCFVDSTTEIVVNANDPEPHPVGEVLCDWSVVVKDATGAELDSYGDAGVVPPFSISFPEESFHELAIDCYDELGNTAHDFEIFEADHTPPGITKTYGDPYFEGYICEIGDICMDDYFAKWINSVTPIFGSVTDDGTHKSGIQEVKYRTTRVDDEYCKDRSNHATLAIVDVIIDDGDGDEFICDDAPGDGEWTYVASEDFDNFEFAIPEDSCHLIEIVAKDNVDKENTHKQCVFVDNQPPEPTKIVGEPKDMWTPGLNGDSESYWYPEETANCTLIEGDLSSCAAGENCIECWEVTTLTPISMECTDLDPHPVDHETVCFKVDVDGCDETERYCEIEPLIHGPRTCLTLGDGCGDSLNEYRFNESGDGYCCVDHEITDFYFKEETEHNLEYYCVDTLGNKGPVDEEKFKVEGTKFEIPLFKKWNLISVPFTLLDGRPEVVFKDISQYINSVWTYDPENCEDDWCVWTPGEGTDDLDMIRPGWGYWVLVTNKPEDCEENEFTMCPWGGEEPLWLVIGGSLFSPATSPPSRNLDKGWNLVGYYGTNWEKYEWGDFNFMCGDAFRFPDKVLYGDKVYCALNSLIDTQEGYPRWSSLWSFVNCGNHMTSWMGLNACIDPSPHSMQDKMYAGRGYWLELDVPDIYAPATNCIWNTDFQCVWTGGGPSV